MAEIVFTGDLICNPSMTEHAAQYKASARFRSGDCLFRHKGKRFHRGTGSAARQLLWQSPDAVSRF